MTKKRILTLVTGGFDPLHSGHIKSFKEAKEHCQYLVVGVNSDNWLTLKKGKPFMQLKERKAILEAIRYVDEVFVSIDDYELIDEDGRKHVPIVQK